MDGGGELSVIILMLISPKSNAVSWTSSMGARTRARNYQGVEAP